MKARHASATVETGGKATRLVRLFARSERGTQLVELAIVLPVLVVMLGAAAEFGRFFYTYQTLAKATRTGARYLTTETANGKKDPAAENLVVYGNEAGTGKPVVSGLSPSQVQITRTGGTSAIPERVTVKIVGYTYAPVFDLGKLVGKKSLSLSIDVSPSTTMRYFSSIPS
ncbi:MAG TPA: TadE family protein [Pyrinomonadaceae bacterium]|nr:TadE family protein [Pyrinomonadaceae bacterium]